MVIFMEKISMDELKSMNQGFLDEKLDLMFEAIKNMDFEEMKTTSEQYMKALKYRSFSLPLLLHFNDKKIYKKVMKGEIEFKDLDDLANKTGCEISPVIAEGGSRRLISIFSKLENASSLISYKNTINVVIESNLSDVYEKYIKNHDDIDGIIVNPLTHKQPLGREIVQQLLVDNRY